MGFRSGAFITDCKIQPVAINYKCWFMKKGYSTISWVDMNPGRYFYDLFVIPFISVEIEYLEPMEMKGLDPITKSEKSSTSHSKPSRRSSNNSAKILIFMLS